MGTVKMMFKGGEKAECHEESRGELGLGEKHVVQRNIAKHARKSAEEF